MGHGGSHIEPLGAPAYTTKWVPRYQAVVAVNTMERWSVHCSTNDTCSGEGARSGQGGRTGPLVRTGAASRGNLGSWKAVMSKLSRGPGGSR